MSDIWPVVVGAIAALAGSLVTSFIQRTQSNSDRLRELLIAAYREYLTGVAERASLLHDHSGRTEAATAKMVAGKQMIAAYAPAAVVRALADLERTPLRLSEQNTQAAMVRLVNEMRKSTGNVGENLDADISTILFSSEFI